ncbi:hypothetical protein Hanom_Chr16g01441601 [Helianthus anomalus]
MFSLDIAFARSHPSVDVNDEFMEIETVVTSSKKEGNTVIFTSMDLGSTLDLDLSLEVDGDLVSSVPPS